MNPHHPWPCGRRSRRGTILIIVAGIAGLLASLAVAFLAMIQRGSESSGQVVRESQARIMLHAACAYVLETARIGWDPKYTSDGDWRRWTNQGSFKTNPGHREAFGWADVRGGTASSMDITGPRDQAGNPIATTAGVWPAIGGVVICPMYRWTEPPYAIRGTMLHNPIRAEDRDAGTPWFGRPFLLNPDPQPVVANGWPETVNNRHFGSPMERRHGTFRDGMPEPVQGSLGLAWFRVRRISMTRFVVTCGAGSTMGFKDWDEVCGIGTDGHRLRGDVPMEPADRRALFDDNRQLFESLRATETRSWYEIQWSAAVRQSTYNTMVDGPRGISHVWVPPNATQSANHRIGHFVPNPLGTISYIQRLRIEELDKQHPDTGTMRSW